MAPRKHLLVFLIISLNFLVSCQSKSIVNPAFVALSSDITGLNFVNKLTPSRQFNIFKYLYFYNGAGIGAGDFNNDGKIDLFFAANQGDDKLFLNEGNLQFKDVTAEATIPQDGGWSTGVSVVDINNDGLLDIYICRVGNFETLKSHNQLLICQGIDKNGVPYYKDEAHEYGLDFSGFSSQAVFFDYDGDGDLDMYLMNHSIHQNGTFGIRSKLSKTTSPVSGDRFFRNNGNNTFTEVTKETGINSSVLGYGLGIGVSDIDLDGYPDLYVGNDFHENDYLYINQCNGTFKEDLTNRMMHTSQFSMGVDIADLNNDSYPEIISMDMLPSDPEILKSSLGEDEYDLFYEKLGYGYNYQYTRNALQFNRRNGMFSETGLYSGIYATDWSWAPLLMDFDNDGLKDLFISNGISRRLNDIDYLNYVSDDALQARMKADTQNNSSDIALIDKLPQKNIPNRFFRNQGNLLFEDIGNKVAHNIPTYSNGSVYADFDNDGDLDVVVNNVDAPATLYQNTENDHTPGAYLDVKLKGSEKNINALGAKIFVFAAGAIRYYENYPVHGFLSSMQIPMHIGLNNTRVDSILLVWPDNTYEPVNFSKKNILLSLAWTKGLPRFNYNIITSRYPNPTKPAEDITARVGLNYLHKEDVFQEFNREPLLPHMLSTEGPALAVGDVNHDGQEDVFIGSAKWEKSALFIQKAGKFQRVAQPDLERDSTYEDIDACFTDLNNDGFPDLVVASGGNEYYGKDSFLTPRVYINDGLAHFHKLNNAFDSLYVNASCVVPCDFNGDGYPDLFIGGRSVPWNYGMIPRSYLLQNDGKGKFSDVTEKYAPGLAQIGMVTQAIWFDIDKDGDKDLLITLEWGGIVAFLNNHGHFTEKVLTDKKGWWNFVLPVDLNNDGNIDLIAGNLGLNSRLKASDKEPVRLYYNDFDNNGKKEQLLTYYLEGKELEFANKGELEKQIPSIKKNFLHASDFARASLQDIFTKEKLKNADTLTANYFANAILMNDGKLNFTVQPMPWQGQLSPYRDAVVVDANGDNLPDILLVGNYYENNIQMGRYDADFGTILLNKGNGQFSCESLNGLTIKGQVRHVREVSIGKKPAYILARNNDSTMVIQFKK